EGRPAPDRVKEANFAGRAIAPDADTPGAAAGGGNVPALGRIVELTGRAIGDARLLGRIERDRRQIALLIGRRVEEVRAAARAVIVHAEIRSIRRADAVDHAGFHIGDVKLL